MLFSFPQDDYQDGSFIEKSGKYHRLNDYHITTKSFTEAGGQKYSFGWKVDLGDIKDGQYMIIPKIDGQLNLFYFELAAGIYNKKGKQVGLCMVGLLPGARNPQNKINPINMFKKV